MRKNIRKSIIEIVKTIYDAHDEIKKYIKNGDLESAGKIIGDCQDSVIAIGETIQSSEGEDFVTIELIENYCRDLFDAYNSLDKETDYNELCKLLNKDLTKIKKSIEKDIAVKIEVVFLPYKASMWDSLESVWKAADEDPECDAYVVPIPYYDRNPDHSFGEFHYEGDEYPDYVPVVHYNEYDLKKRRPDVIYIHNPYDGNNYVTSVDPRFYSSELKKYTNKLVYIPYFVLEEIEPNDKNAVEQMKHFITTPGVINSDEVIVQSEKMKEVYVKVLLEVFENVSENKKLFENKIKGTGSPKFDKIQNINIDDISVPNNWKRIIFKADGSRKKVVFYNTGIAALLENNEKWIKKISDSLKIFKENSEKIALLWRPHPLIITTIESMRPQFANEYKKIVNDYVKSGWGIYDDSFDLNRAIVMSDAYYGDSSSVVQLFKKIGKVLCLTQYWESFLFKNGILNDMLTVDRKSVV